MCYNNTYRRAFGRTRGENCNRNVFQKTNGGGLTTEEMIKEIKHIQQCLINVDMEGEDYEEKMDAVHKLEDVVTYLKDALGKGIEF